MPRDDPVEDTCANCHTSGTYHANIDNVHDLDGSSCHGDSGDVRSIHGNCGTCHYPGAWLPGANGGCDNCHDDQHC